MGLFTKKEKYNPETGRFEPVPRQPIFSKQVSMEGKELTREEQFETKKHPWQTTRGKKVIAGTKKVVGKVDKAVVNYNRTRNPLRSSQSTPRRSSPSFNNYNPFGTTFDRGVKPMKKSSSKGTKYVIRGGKAYPVVGTGKKARKHKRKKKSKRKDDVFSWDFGDWRW